jgi:sortase A
LIANLENRIAINLGGRIRGIASALLLVVGVLLVTEVLVTLAWKEPLSALRAGRAQHELSEQLRRAEAQALSAPAGFRAGEAPQSGRVALAAHAYRKRTSIGDPLGRIEIPELGARFVFIEGASGSELAKGPGHYPGTAMPGERGTVGVAGHRTTHLAPFRHIDGLERGDQIVLEMPYGVFRYSVDGTKVVKPTDTAALRRTGHDRLVLTTCTPPFSAAKRLVVDARLRTAALRRQTAAGRVATRAR